MCICTGILCRGCRLSRMGPSALPPGTNGIIIGVDAGVVPHHFRWRKSIGGKAMDHHRSPTVVVGSTCFTMFAPPRCDGASHIRLVLGQFRALREDEMNFR